jgi:hypothetical protein
MNRGSWLVGRRAVFIVAAVAVIVAVGAGFALAAGKSGVIKACANKHTGALRVAKKCKKHERALSWNVQGPAGRTGKTGATGPAGSPGAPGVQYAWSSWVYPAQDNPPSGGGKVATFTLTSPAAGFALVTAEFQIRVRNNGTNDCHVESQLSKTAGPIGAVQPGPGGGAGAGYTDQWVNSNLPTENGGGTALGLSGSVSDVFPVTAGTNTIYLNGQDDSDDAGYACTIAYYGPISMSAVFANQNPSSTLTGP